MAVPFPTPGRGAARLGAVAANPVAAALVPAAAADDRQSPEGAPPVRGAGASRPAAPAVEHARRAMVETIRRHAAENGETIAPGVLEAVGSVPREEFVPPSMRTRAFDDTPLPIGGGQTISQPYVVARMTDLAGLEPGDRVLEIGTGCGYQTAVLAALVAKVFTIEIVGELAHEAAATLRRLGVGNVETRVGDGWFGWPEEAPFDAILVTAAPAEVPPPLVEQLAVGARLVIPVGSQREFQRLQVLEKLGDGTVATRDVLPVRFVPLTRRT